MSELTDFLLARIAEDEGRADRVEFHPYVGDGIPSPLTARVLAECEAKRQIVEHLIDAEQVLLGRENAAPNSPPPYWQALQFAATALAMPYADHPDYREEWKP